MTPPVKSPVLPSEDSPFWIRSKIDIKQVIKNLAKKRERIIVWVNPNESFISVILETDGDSMILDCSGDELINEKALKASSLIISANLDLVSIRFALRDAERTEFEGQQAFEVMMPDQIHKLQRREYFRLPTPLVQPLTCAVKKEVKEAGKALPDFIRANAQLVDIGLGGLSLLEPTETLQFAAGDRFLSCELDLKDAGKTQFDIEICHVFEVENRTGQLRRRAGCKFINLSRSAESVIQKYITKLERERIALIGD